MVWIFSIFDSKLFSKSPDTSGGLEPSPTLSGKFRLNNALLKQNNLSFFYCSYNADLPAENHNDPLITFGDITN